MDLTGNQSPRGGGMLDVLVPQWALTEGGETARRARVLATGVVVMCTSGAFFAWQSYRSAGSVSAQVVLLVLGMALGASNLPVATLARSLVLPSALLCLEVFAVLAWMGWIGGGAADASQVWLIMLPLLGAFLVGPRFGLALGAAVLGLEGCFYWASQSVREFAPPGEDQAWFSFLSVGTMALGAAGVAWMFESGRAEAADKQRALLTEFQRANGSLEQAARELAEARDAAEGAARRKGEFLDRLSASCRSQEVALADARVALARVASGIRTLSSTVGTLADTAEQAEQSSRGTLSAGDRMRSTAEDMLGAASEGASSIDAMTAGMAQLAQAVAEVSRAVEGAGAAMRSLEQGAATVERDASVTRELGTAVLAEAARGQQAVHRSLEGIQHIRGSADQTEHAVRTLAEQVNQIGTLLTVIDDVTRQTRLLSLNAAIIAAQSGEAGRAFAVVAEQMQGLAERTGSSTAEIVGIIHGLQEQARLALAALDQGRQSVARGVQLSGETETVLGEITAAIRRASSTIGAIAETASSQAQQARRVSGEMEGVQAAARRAADTAQRQARGAEAFALLARRLREAGPALENATEQQAVGAEATGAAVQRIHALVTRIHDAQREQGDASEQILRTVESIHSSQHDQVTTIREMEAQDARDTPRGTAKR